MPLATISRPDQVGVLLVNLGTPSAPTARAIRRYLAEFLSDRRVIEIPRLLWWPILHGLVLPRRPAALARKYQRIWLPEGSPLLVYTQKQAEGVARRLRDIGPQGPGVSVRAAMRYGDPSIPDAIDGLRAEGCERILVVPLYPQYAASTVATVVDAVAAHAATLRDQPALRFVKRFYDDPGYLDAQTARISDYWAAHGRPEKLLMSFHGLPERAVELGDPYHGDCLRTAELLRERLGLAQDEMLVTFQSRFGRAKWLQPATEPALRDLARGGVRRVDVVCPGFVTDCLETLEEIAQQCRVAFLDEGGEQLRHIPALNDSPAWLDALANMVAWNLQGWA